MKLSLATFAAAGLIVGALVGTTHVSASPGSSEGAATTANRFVYGHIRSLRATGRSFELRFDPAWWLTGRTAERAKREDTGSDDVPNDYYIVEEGHRLLTYVVPRNARVTVLTRGGDRTTVISVSELAQIVRGRNPRHRRLLMPRAGFWIGIGDKYPSPALTLDQQYQP